MKTKMGCADMPERFRGFLPVVVDVETGGLCPETDALLEITAVLVQVDKNRKHWRPGKTISKHVEPYAGLRLCKDALNLTGIRPENPFRKEITQPEGQALREIFDAVREAKNSCDCKYAILVGHNAAFDLAVLNAAIARNHIKRNPFHKFSTFDTVSLAGLVYGQTVLARAVQAAGFEWNESEAHTAQYDAEQTAKLFCHILNLFSGHD